MPSWAADSPSEYWDAADLHERANGRLYVSADFALPRDLSLEVQISLAHDFAQELTADEALPYTLAIHGGCDARWSGAQPACASDDFGAEERRDRTQPGAVVLARESDDPARGGAEKTRAIHGRAWTEHARARWADLTNKTLAKLGRDERVDHRSYERQGIDREAGRHYGPSAAPVVSRGATHDRLEVAAGAASDRDRLDAIDQAIAGLETERGALVSEDQKRTEWEWASSSGAGVSGDSGRDHDDSRSR